MQDRKLDNSQASQIKLSATPSCLFSNADAKSINVVFLDIDGVLIRGGNGDRNREAFEKNESFVQSKLGDSYKKLDLYDIGAALLFSKDAIDNLKSLCQKTNAKIVISSNWRINGEERRDESLAKLRGLFKLWDLDSLIIDQTPDCHYDRVEEINKWLALMGKKVNNFVILDDIDGGLSKAFPKKFIYTGDTCLFNERHLADALSVFGQEIHALSLES